MAATTGGSRAHGGGWAAGAVVFAALMLLVNGTLGILEGATAVAKNKVYVATPHYVYQFSLTSWGWIHIVLGIIAILALVVRHHHRAVRLRALGPDQRTSRQRSLTATLLRPPRGAPAGRAE